MKNLPSRFSIHKNAAVAASIQVVRRRIRRPLWWRSSNTRQVGLRKTFRDCRDNAHEIAARSSKALLLFRPRKQSRSLRIQFDKNQTRVRQKFSIRVYRQCNRLASFGSSSLFSWSSPTSQRPSPTSNVTWLILLQPHAAFRILQAFEAYNRLQRFVEGHGWSNCLPVHTNDSWTHRHISCRTEWRNFLCVHWSWRHSCPPICICAAPKILCLHVPKVPSPSISPK